jgi:methionyl-tRNA formyltransferase
VKAVALKHELRVEQPATLRSPEHIDHLRSFEPDLMIVVAYGLILPQTVLDIPRLGCINIHASLLPRWRGAAPIHRAIQAGDEATGVTIMRMEAGLDTGPMLLELREPILRDDTTASLHDRLAQRGAEALLTALPGIADRSLEARIQPSEGVTYAAKIAKEEARIDWSRSAVEIDRQIRAFNPWPVAETKLKGAQLRIWSASASREESAALPGTIIGAGSAGVRVATGKGVLALTRVQVAGRKATSADEFIRGQSIDGIVLGE